MGEVHMSPRDAVEAHLALQARVSVASHFGTFRLADDGQDEPVQFLQHVLSQYRFAGFRVLDTGLRRRARIAAAGSVAGRIQTNRLVN